MAIKDIIARGIGFSPGSVKFIVTHGFLAIMNLIPAESLIGEDTGISLTAEDAGISLRGETSES